MDGRVVVISLDGSFCNVKLTITKVKLTITKIKLTIIKADINK